MLRPAGQAQRGSAGTWGVRGQGRSGHSGPHPLSQEGHGQDPLWTGRVWGLGWALAGKARAEAGRPAPCARPRAAGGRWGQAGQGPGRQATGMGQGG